MLLFLHLMSVVSHLIIGAYGFCGRFSSFNSNAFTFGYCLVEFLSIISKKNLITMLLLLLLLLLLSSLLRLLVYNNFLFSLYCDKIDNDEEHFGELYFIDDIVPHILKLEAKSPSWKFLLALQHDVLRLLLYPVNSSCIKNPCLYPQFLICFSCLCELKKTCA